MTDDRPSDDQILRYMATAAYRRRAKRVQAKIKARMDAGEPWTFDEIARELRLPLDVVLSGFAHSMAKRGRYIVPTGRVQ